MLKISDYLNKPGISTTSQALSLALRELQDGDTLLLEGLTLELDASFAEHKYYYISNNDCGDKAIAFPIIGKKNITIDGEGASLIFHGLILPFVVDKSENITLTNFSIDYASPVYAEAKIIEASENCTLLNFDRKEFFCRVSNNSFCFYSENDGWENCVDHCLVTEFDKDSASPSAYIPPYFPYTGEPRDHGFLGSMFRDVKLTELRDGLILMDGKLGFTHTVGNYIVFTHSSREYPGIFVNESVNVLIDNISLYHTTSMGVICQLSENITLSSVRAVRRDGSKRMLTVAADATHFVNCRGTITLKGCVFVHMMDDAVNIHGIYTIPLRLENNNSIVVTFGHKQQRGINFCRKGDKLNLIDREAMEIKQVLTVRSSALLSPDELLIECEEAIPSISPLYLLENISTAPIITISDCESGGNRPRGFLLSSSGKTTVERCRFFNMNCGIQLSGEMVDWYESGNVEDVTIKDCDFTNSAYAGGAALSFSPRLYNMKPSSAFNGRISVIGNVFRQHEKRIMNVSLACELIFKDNVFIKDASLPSHPGYSESGFNITDCGLVDIAPLKEYTSVAGASGTALLETERLILRQFINGDAKAALRNWMNDRDVTEYLRWQAFDDLSTAEWIITSWIEKYSDPMFFQWAIVPKELSEPIGTISIVESETSLSGEATLEVGYCIGKKYWHKGITSEALKEMMRYLFTDIGISRLRARHDPRNHNSGAVMSKCGMKYIKTSIGTDYNNKGKVDAAIYEINRVEYYAFIRNEESK